MSHVILLGAEEVSRAGNRIQEAANTMQSAANSIQEAVQRLDTLLSNFSIQMTGIVERLEADFKEEEDK